MPKLSDMGYYTWKPGGDSETTAYGVMLPLKYDAIAADLGLIKQTDEATADAIKMSTNDACKRGLLIKLRINYRTTTGRGSADIVCNPKEVAGALGKLNGKTYGAGNTIRSVRGRPKQDFR